MLLLHGSLKSHAFLYFCQQNTTADPSKIGMLLYSIIQACRYGAKASGPRAIEPTELWVFHVKQGFFAKKPCFTIKSRYVELR